MAFRGESARALKMAHSFSLKVPNEGPNECKALIAIFGQKMTNQVVRIEFGVCIRNRDVRICGIGTLGLYLLYCFHVESEEAPDFVSQRSWYDKKILLANGRKPTTPVLYKPQ